MMILPQFRWFLLASLVSSQVLAAEFESVLIPLYLPAASDGAYGTRWSTDLSVWNVGPAPLLIFQSQCAHDCSCAVPGSCTPGTPTDSGAMFRGALYPNDDFGVVPAILLHIESTDDRNVAASLRVRERSRHDHAGIEIPVVREEQITTGPLWLVDVPTRDDFRQHVRVYFVASPAPAAAVRVRVFREGEHAPVLDQRVPATPPLYEGRVPLERDLNAPAPGYAILALPPGVSGGAPAVRIQVTSETEGLRFWAMASVTHNGSQHVTLVTPQ